MTNRTNVVYVEIEIEFSWPIGQDLVYYEKQKEQLDRSYRCDLRKMQYWISRSIGQCALYDKNEIRQQHDQSYRSSLCRKQN